MRDSRILVVVFAVVAILVVLVGARGASRTVMSQETASQNPVE
jgi:hypothetical protein